jgi:hypothetical protein
LGWEKISAGVKKTLRKIQPWRREPGREKAETRARGGNHAISPAGQQLILWMNLHTPSFAFPNPCKRSGAPFVSHFHFSVKLLRWKTFTSKRRWL